MKTKLSILIGFLILLAFIVPGVAATGSDAVGEKHFTLNITGVMHPRNVGVNLDSGNTLFVSLNRDGSKVTTQINLTQGDFQVLDKIGTDGFAAFALPYPYTKLEGTTAGYKIYIKALGKPERYANMTTCYWDTQTSTTWCDTGNTVKIQRPTDKNTTVKFTKVTSQLTTVFRVPIFSDPFNTYWWQYDNFGRKHTELGFF